MKIEKEEVEGKAMKRGREWRALCAKLEGYASIYDEPIPSLSVVNTIPDAPICGGGKLTVALAGSHREVSYHISKSDFWHVVPNWQMLLQKYHIRQAPLCQLHFTLDNAACEADGFQHVQDMATAEVRSELPLENGLLKVRCVALAQRDLVVYELNAVDAAALLTVRLDTRNEKGNFFILKGTADDRTVWLRKEHSSIIEVGAAMALRAVGAGDVATVYDKGFASTLAFTIQPGSPVRLLLSVKGGKDDFHALEKALSALDELTEDDGALSGSKEKDNARGPGASPGHPGHRSVDDLLTEHAAWWKAFWMRSWIDLNDPLLERFYYGAQYVHGCSIDLDGRTVPGLAGGWITNEDPIWGGTYTMNYNGESPFWGLSSSNRGEWLAPYARVCLDYIGEGRKLAQRLDTKGIVMPVMIGPWGIPDNNDALGQKSNASMAALSLIWHYESTLDTEFLETVLYPYLHELMDFWEDNLTLDDSGRYVIAGSARERNPGDLNPGEDLAFVRQILDVMITASEALGLDVERRDRWCDFQTRLSDTPVANVDGQPCFKEAENRMNVSHKGVGDNVCALNPVYPGGAIDRDPTGKGRIIARNTLRYMQSWDQENAFTRVFCQAVRAEWPGEDLVDRFKSRIGAGGEGPFERLRRNNTFLPGHHSFEGTAPTEFINSMLAHAHGGVLKVFHVWPKERDAAFARIRVRGAFLVSGVLKDGEVQSVQVFSEKGQPCRMLSCWPGRGIHVDRISDEDRASTGDRISLDCARDAGVYEWDTEAGGVYRVTAGQAVSIKESNPPLMLVPMIEPAVRAGEVHTDADLDLVLTPGRPSTALALDAIYADESRMDVTAVCTFAVRDEKIAEVSSKGMLTAKGRGRTVVDVTAEIDGVPLSCSISVYVLALNVIADVSVIVPTSVEASLQTGFWNNPHSLEKAYGMDSPDVTARMRANSYGFGCYAVPMCEERTWIQFDLGALRSLGEMWVWNFNAPDDYRVLWWNGGTAVGMRDVTIDYSEDGERWTELRTNGFPFRLAKATGRQWMAATNLDDGSHTPVRFHGARARYVRITPAAETGVGNWGAEKVGLGQVRFTEFDLPK